MWFQNLTQAGLSLVTATVITVAFSFESAFAEDPEKQFADHLRFGEFSKALELVEEFPRQMVDRKRLEISSAQKASGANQAARDTAQRILSDKLRMKALAQQGFLGGGPFGGGNGLQGNGRFGAGVGGNGVVQNGQAGGVTEADFQPLINLIKSTIDPDSWDDATGDGTIQAYPAGVFVDSTGTLRKLKIDTKRSLKRIANVVSNDSGNRWSTESTELRKVSLTRLEKQAQILAAQGQPIPAEMQNLAGIYEIEYLMFLPETKEIVIAGPAGEWQTDFDGHAINKKTGKPVLQLDDLVVCLRNAQRGPLGNNGKFGCSITPRKKNLAATREFVSTSKLKGKAWRKQLRSTLGKQDIEVFGIDPATHAAMVLVEADYRMKLVAMGLESSIPDIPSYLSRLGVGPNGEFTPMDVVRWWFTMNYDDIVADPNRHVFQFNGTGVKVLSENEFINNQGDRIHTGQSDGPTAGFARDFTRHFDKIADQYPVYRRLKNLFDLSIVSALIRSYGLDNQADWNLTYFGNNPEFADYVYQPVTAPAPTEVDSVMNHRVISRRKQSSTVKHTLVGVSGGITFDAVSVIQSKSKVNNNAAFGNTLSHAKLNVDSANWWWD